MNYIRECLQIDGNYPTIRDIGEAVGFAPSTAHRIINNLVAQGYLVKIGEGRRRRIDIAFDRVRVQEAVRMFRDGAIGETRAMTLILQAVPEV